jgi:acyl carrier protein
LGDLRAEVLTEIRRVAREELEYQGEVMLGQRLKEDLQLDSVAMIVVATQLENRFRVMLKEEDAGQIATVEDLVVLVVKRIGEAKPG